MKPKKQETLRTYFEDAYQPAKIAAGAMQPKTLAYYRRCVLNFLEFVGYDIPLRRIGSDLLARFVARQMANGQSMKVTRNCAWAIKSIVRHKHPDAFPTEGKGSNQQGVNFADADIQGTLVRDCYLPERTRISSEHTIRQYGRCLHLFSMYLGEPCEPKHLTDRIVGQFLRQLVEVGGVKPTTANGYVKQLKSLWVWLAKKRVVAMFPTIQKLKEPEPIAIAWTRDELQKFLSSCREQVGMFGDVLANLYWTAFHLVLWDSGERTGAMLSLKWDWLDWKSGHLTVPGEFRKGRQKSMVYRLKPATIEALKEIRAPRRDLIFDPVVDRNTWYRRYRQLLVDADLPYQPHKSGPQKWRRSFASHIEAAGGNATRALKHRDRRVTEDSYLDPKITEVESENVMLSPLGGDA